MWYLAWYTAQASCLCDYLAAITRLQWKQVSIERRHLWVSAEQHKNGKPHSVPLNDVALQVLEKLKGDHPTHVFTYEGHPIVQVSTGLGVGLDPFPRTV